MKHLSNKVSVTLITPADAEAALALAVRVSPNGLVQAEFAKIYNRLVSEGASWDRITTSLIGATLDGMRHGKWPGKVLTMGEEK